MFSLSSGLHLPDGPTPSGSPPISLRTSTPLSSASLGPPDLSGPVTFSPSQDTMAYSTPTSYYRDTNSSSDLGQQARNCRADITPSRPYLPTLTSPESSMQLSHTSCESALLTPKRPSPTLKSLMHQKLSNFSDIVQRKEDKREHEDYDEEEGREDCNEKEDDKEGKLENGRAKRFKYEKARSCELRCQVSNGLAVKRPRIWSLVEMDPSPKQEADRHHELEALRDKIEPSTNALLAPSGNSSRMPDLSESEPNSPPRVQQARRVQTPITSVQAIGFGSHPKIETADEKFNVRSRKARLIGQKEITHQWESLRESDKTNCKLAPTGNEDDLDCKVFNTNKSAGKTAVPKLRNDEALLSVTKTV
ncbi:unnamed protein product [Protopolystoma xenopodis]|uniref:Uncharacterized protein n=1 Tax=Protopolystoma xenopodis TaxID=117903 RepID=A0A448XB16_9PLAT|nr:unnamed protein product [Protopolystoma xenopodis]